MTGLPSSLRPPPPASVLIANSAFFTHSWAAARRVVAIPVSSSPMKAKTKVRRGRWPAAFILRMVDTREVIPVLLSPVPRPKK
jgi:hypothetical protein